MPTKDLMKLPKTSSPEEFESICRDVIEKMYNCKFQKYGRKGQKQRGIDLISTDYDKTIAVQCKNYSNTRKKEFLKTINNDIHEVEKIESIDILIIMTAINTDKDIQDFITSIMSSFKIIVVFWDEIEDVVLENKKIMTNYYPDYVKPNFIKLKHINKAISSIERLEDSAKMIYKTRDRYKGDNYEQDVQIYNLAVTIMNSSYDLATFKDKWSMQLDGIGAKIIICSLIDELPEFYNEESDIIGSSLLVTVVEFRKTYCNEDYYKKFNKQCNKLKLKLIEYCKNNNIN